jgi:hypothetical protein
MPWNLTRSGQFVEREILKYVSGLEVIKSVVLDANDAGFAMPVSRDQRNVIPAGTILTKGTVDTTKYIKFAGSGTVAGILLHSVEIMANVTAGNEPVPMIYFNAVFATPAIVGFTNYATNLVTDLNSCKFE